MAALVPSHSVRGALHTTMDLQTVNRAQALECFNPSAEVDSLAEEVVALRQYGVPVAVRRRVLARVARVLELNREEGQGERALAGLLDDLATALAHAERNGALAQSSATKRLACELRPHLAVLRKPPVEDGVAYFKASAAIRDIIGRCPRSQLLSPTMRNQLRDGPFGQLLQLIESVETVDA